MLSSIRLSSGAHGKHNLMPAYRQVLPESSDLKWKKAFALLEKVGKTQWYVVEYEVEGMPPLESVRHCPENLRKMGM